MMGATSATLGDNLPAVPLGGPAVSVCAGRSFSCAVYEDSTAGGTRKVKCWGSAEHSELVGGHYPRTLLVHNAYCCMSGSVWLVVPGHALYRICR